MKTLNTTLLTLLTIFALLATSSAEETTEESSYDLSGRWKVLLSNSITRKQVTFDLEQKDGRPRGHMYVRDLPEQKLDGRLEGKDQVKFWGIFRDRGGNTEEYEFKGTIEGEPGKEKIRGKSDFFGKRYEFVGVRARKKKKKKK